LLRLAAIACLFASTARADDRIAAVAPAADARQAMVIGPLGQLYEPDGHGAWTRTHAGGTSSEIVTATAGATVIAGARDAPPYKLVAGAWSVVVLGLKAKAIVGAGPRATAASGRHVFTLDAAAPLEQPLAPAEVTAIAASATGIAIATAAGLFRLEGRAWKPIANAPAGAALLTERWARAGDAVFDLRAGRPVTPGDLHVVAAAVLADGALLAVGTTTAGANLRLLSLRGGKASREDTPLDRVAPVVAIVGDHAGRVVVAVRDGRLAIREPGAGANPATWSVTEVREAPPTPRQGPGPAISR
jgi:hypothetical protein